ncbi:molybdopterin converting factor subunit 1 [Bacillus gaemokensis]|uniref:Molybdopterin synthase sulfur carrier subunit n=1 Tax=Bacillus gaemokensis TaxID=574375 RepID=A0A073KB85_9BACI|nr:molybdopterin converting factor subunit 1 [Bacillus gaemokensis]KEK24524.1 molybdenum cofactor biosynthesis protein MoaD [Bacillus gaemokensis]KYG39413.1 molybdopterin synthase sulfur carrier subunit [Bacillus gaemokensis]
MIQVLLFAHLQEEAGTSALKIDGGNITVTELKEILTKEHHLAVSEQVMVAVNEEYANADDKIHDGDIVALIPPVSGG